ncbi:MAG: ABC transporter ATP-binding protein [Nitriliruptorales bacterium]
MSRTVLELRDVHRSYGQTPAVRGLSFSVEAGELVALVGPSGCGKSTALRLVAGLEVPESGSVLIDGEVVAGEGRFVPPERRQVGIVFQDHALFPHLTVADNVAFGLGERRTPARETRVAEILELVRLGGHADRYPHELSGGEQQRVALARALAPDPAVILLDEPFSDLDRNLRLRVRAETVALLRGTGTTAVFVTHDQAEALAVGERVLVMRTGRLEQSGVPAEVFHAPTNRFVATFMGEADFLPGVVRAGALVTEAGPCPLPSGAAEGEALEVMVRPHEVTFTVDPGGDDVVAGTEFQGGFALYELRLASGRTVRSLQPHTVVVAPGTAVRVVVDHGHVPALFQGQAAVHRDPAGAAGAPLSPSAASPRA